MADTSAHRSAVRQLRSGDRIGKYELIEPVGVGGMGTVWRVQVPGDRPLAMKILDPQASPAHRRRFQAEGETMSRLRHPHIAPVLEVGNSGELAYLVMPYIAGAPVDTWAEGASTEAMLLVLADVADALHHAHSHGLIHRDIKPANILVREDGFVFLVDFGLVRELNEDDHLVTQDSEAVGTPPYMSPEQAMARADDLGPATDIWSLGVVAYVLTTERLPFSGETVFETFKAVVEEAPTPPRKLEPTLSEDLEALILCCLEKERSRRFATAADLASALRDAARGNAVALPVTRSTLVRLPSIDLSVLALVVLLSVGLLWLLLWKQPILATFGGLVLVALLPGIHLFRRLAVLARSEQESRRSLRELRRFIAEEQHQDWVLLHQGNFDQDDIENNWDIDGGFVRYVENGCLRGGGQPTLTWFSEPIVGDFRLRLVALQSEPLNDFGIGFANDRSRACALVMSSN